MFRNYSMKKIVAVVAMVSLVMGLALALLEPQTIEQAPTVERVEVVIVATPTTVPVGECDDKEAKGVVDRTMAGQNILSYAMLTSTGSDADLDAIAGLAKAHERHGDEIAVALSNAESCAVDVLLSTQRMYNYFASSYDDAQPGDFAVAYYQGLVNEFWQVYSDAFGRPAARKLSEAMVIN